MKAKLFHNDGEFVLYGDERDIMIARSLRDDVFAWCKTNNIDASITTLNFKGWDLWRVVDDGQRMWFNIRFAA